MRYRSQVTGQSLITLQTEELSQAYQVAENMESSGGQVHHIYGPRVMIGKVPPRAEEEFAAMAAVRSVDAQPVEEAPEALSEAEQLGLEAFNLRKSPEFEEAKRYRKREGARWDMEGETLPPDGAGMLHSEEHEEMAAPAPGVEDMSPYLIGSVAVGILMVEGPTPDLQFTAQERAKVVAEVQEGLSWLGQLEPRASVTWAYDIRTIRVDVHPNPNLTGYEPLESLWRDPAIGQLGFSPTFMGVHEYVSSIRRSLGTRWGYVGFFTKYPVHHFAYARKPRLVMHYENDGWGPDNIDRLFTHETGHIFGCPDEYKKSNCSCQKRYGFLQEVNGNCELCAQPFVPCLMAANTWAMCPYTPVHLGWRDSDGDGTLDPVDPLDNPSLAVDWRRIARHHPELADLIGNSMRATTPALSADPLHDSIPLFLLRRVLDAEDMARVEHAISQEEGQYLEALSRKLNNVARKIKPRR